MGSLAQHLDELFLAIEDPSNLLEVQHFFCGESGKNSEDLLSLEGKRLEFYNLTDNLIRAYSQIANRLLEAGFSGKESSEISEKVSYYQHRRNSIEMFSGDTVDMKLYEPGMRALVDMYITSKDSIELINFQDKGLMDVLLSDDLPSIPEDLSEPLIEGIENTLSRKIKRQSHLNPTYFNSLSDLLSESIRNRRKDAVSYKKYLNSIKNIILKAQGEDLELIGTYPASMDTRGKRSLYDNLGKDEDLVLAIDEVIQTNKGAAWSESDRGVRRTSNLINKLLDDYSSPLADNVNSVNIVNLLKAQEEYL